MGDALATCLPMLAFMFIPVWIPIIGTLLGALGDQLRPPTPSPAERAVEAAKKRSVEARRSAAPVTDLGATADRCEAASTSVA